jgi:hypothetical protein
MGSLRSLASCARFEEKLIQEAEARIGERVSNILYHLYKKKDKKIHAIKMLRQIADIGLKEAKDTIEGETWDKCIGEISREVLILNMKAYNIDLNKIEAEYGLRPKLEEQE